MPPEADRQLLLRLHGQLAAALERQDWAGMAGIDLAIRDCLQALAGRTGGSDEMRHARRQLQQLHGQARAACADECERLRRVLLTHLEYAEGRSAYTRVDMFQGGR